MGKHPHALIPRQLCHPTSGRTSAIKRNCRPGCEKHGIEGVNDSAISVGLLRHRRMVVLASAWALADGNRHSIRCIAVGLSQLRAAARCACNVAAVCRWQIAIARASATSGGSGGAGSFSSSAIMTCTCDFSARP